MKLFACSTSIILAASACSASELSMEEAKRIVENYVAKQGYTDAPTSLKAEELDGSSFERLPRSEWLASRRGRIHPHAVAYTNDTPMGAA